jgi:hypothetical protein
MHEAELNNIYKFSSYLKKYYVFISRINRLMPFRATVVVYPWNNMRHLNAFLVGVGGISETLY